MHPSTRQPPCDQCYKRRVRCSGAIGHPCSACDNASLKCTRERVRGKRGPKAKPQRHTYEASGNPVSNNSPLSVETSLASGNILGLGRCSPPKPGLIGQTAVHDRAREVGSHLHGEPRHGRAQIQTAHRPSHFVTVNELAGFILGDNGLKEKRTDPYWLRGVRNASVADRQAFSNTPPSLATPGMPTPGKGNDECNAIMMQDGIVLTSNNSVLPLLAQETSIELDGIALALATGLPPQYGREIADCIETYFTRLYHVLPILHEGQFRRLMACPSQLNASQRALLLSLCAVTKLRSCYGPNKTQDREARELGRRFLEQYLSLRCDIDCMEEKSPSGVITAFLVHAAYSFLNMTTSSRYYMREAIGKAMDLGLHREDGRHAQDDTESICSRRTLALLFVTERATAILESYDVLLLQEPPSLPDIVFDDYDHKSLTGFQCLFQLFKLIDTDTVRLWCSETPPREQEIMTTRDKLRTIQDHLTDISFADKDLNDFQRADIQVTKQWLRLIFWQTAMRMGFLSNWSEDPAFSYNYPIELGKGLCSILQSLPETSLHVHHLSIYSKIFEIAYSLMDMIIISGRDDGPGVYELKELFRYLSSSPITNMTYVRILMEKDKDFEKRSRNPVNQ